MTWFTLMIGSLVLGVCYFDRKRARQERELAEAVATRIAGGSGCRYCGTYGFSGCILK